MKAINEAGFVSFQSMMLLLFLSPRLGCLVCSHSKLSSVTVVELYLVTLDQPLRQFPKVDILIMLPTTLLRIEHLSLPSILVMRALRLPATDSNLHSEA